MAYADKADYIAKLGGGGAQVIPFAKVALTTILGRLSDPWVTAGLGGAVPTTAAVCTQDTVGALGGTAAAGGFHDGALRRIPTARISATQAGTYILCDRLSHQGGLSAIVATAQTTNLPTAALTRYTGGTEVFAGLTIYTQIGTTATTVACSYTNEAGTAARVSPLVAIGGTGFREASRFLLLPKAAGDLGVRSVESVTVTATTGTAGAFGVTLFKPLMSFHIERIGEQKTFNFIDGGMQGGLPEVLANACLCWLYFPAGTSVALSGALTISED